MVNTEKYASQRGAVTDGHKSFNSNSILTDAAAGDQERERDRERECVYVFFFLIYF